MFPDFEPEEILPERENQPYRVLPPGLHETTLAEIKKELVDSFIESQTRSDSFARYSQLYADAVAHNLLFCQWLGGSFTTSKSDPGDIDVTTIIHRDVLNGLSGAERAFALGILNAGEATKSYYASHTFMFTYFPPDDPKHEIICNRLRKWRKFWCETRPLQKDVRLSDATIIQQGENYPKGSLCVRHRTDAGFPEL